MLVRLCLLWIWIWQNAFSPLMPKSCRFYPSCSCYAEEALKKHGFWKGFRMSVIRVLKCGPWHPGGVDLP